MPMLSFILRFIASLRVIADHSEADVVQKSPLFGVAKICQTSDVFLRRHRKCVGGESYEYWTLVKTVHTARGPRHQTIAHLGKLDEVQATAILVDACMTRPNLEFVSNLLRN